MKCKASKIICKIKRLDYDCLKEKTVTWSFKLGNTYDNYSTTDWKQPI